MARIVVRENRNVECRIHRIVSTKQVRDGDTVVVPNEDARKFLERMMRQYGLEGTMYFVEVDSGQGGPS